MPRFIDIDTALSSSASADACASIGVQKVANVIGYGATGDGTTDDSDAIIAALNSATDVVVHFPPGVYRVGKSLLKTGGRLRINGRGATIKPTNSYTAQVGVAEKPIVHHLDPVETVIDGLVIDGNSTSINSGSAYSNWTNYVHGIQVSTQNQAIGDAARVVIRNCHVKNYPSAGITVSGVSNIHVTGNTVQDGMFHGIAVSRTSGATASYGWIENNRITGRGNLGTVDSIGGIGIIVTKFDNISITGNRIQNMSDTGTKTEGCNDVLYRGNVVEDSGKDGIKVMSHSVASPGSAIYSVSRATIDGNIVERVNAWRSDGGGLILANNLQHGIITNNILVGGGTRVADAVACTASAGASFTGVGNIVISNNIATGALNRSVYIAGGADASRPAANISILGNRFTGPILGVDILTGTFVISDNTITVPSGTSTAIGINLYSFLSGSVTIESNHVADYAQAMSLYFSTSAQVDNVRIANNSIEGTNSFFLRSEGISASSVKLYEISNNSVSNPTSGGASVQAPWRIGLANMTINTLKINGNFFLSNSSSGSYNYFGEFTGTPSTPIEFMDIQNNIYQGVFNNTYVASLTYGTVVKRAIGYRVAAAPTAGTWAQGDRVENPSPAELGTTPNKYVVTGWRCVTAGTPGTWVAERCLTGN